jgi:hypothetical protein
MEPWQVSRRLRTMERSRFTDEQILLAKLGI